MVCGYLEGWAGMEADAAAIASYCVVVQLWAAANHQSKRGKRCLPVSWRGHALKAGGIAAEGISKSQRPGLLVLSLAFELRLNGKSSWVWHRVAKLIDCCPV
mgnify:CR=1 FL=1